MSASTETPHWVGAAEIARLLGINPKTLRLWTINQKIPKQHMNPDGSKTPVWYGSPAKPPRRKYNKAYFQAVVDGRVDFDAD